MSLFLLCSIVYTMMIYQWEKNKDTRKENKEKRKQSCQRSSKVERHNMKKSYIWQLCTQSPQQVRFELNDSNI